MFFKSNFDSSVIKPLSYISVNNLCESGGLFMPKTVPILSSGTVKDLSECDDMNFFIQIVKMFDNDSSEDELRNIYKNICDVNIIHNELHSNDNFKIFDLTKNQKNYCSLSIGLALEMFAKYRRQENGIAVCILATHGPEGVALLEHVHRFPWIHFVMILPKEVNHTYRAYISGKAKHVVNVKVFQSTHSLDVCKNWERYLLNSQIQDTKDIFTVSGLNYVSIIGYIIIVLMACKKNAFLPIEFCIPSLNFELHVAIDICKKMIPNIFITYTGLTTSSVFKKIMEYGEISLRGENIDDSCANFSSEVPSCFEYMLSNYESLNVFDIYDTIKSDNVAFLDNIAIEDLKNKIECYVINNEKIIQIINKSMKDFNALMDPISAIGIATYHDSKTTSSDLQKILFRFENHMFYDNLFFKILGFKIDMSEDIQNGISQDGHPINVSNVFEVFKFIRDL